MYIIYWHINLIFKLILKYWAVILISVHVPNWHSEGLANVQPCNELWKSHHKLAQKEKSEFCGTRNADASGRAESRMRGFQGLRGQFGQSDAPVSRIFGILFEEDSALKATAFFRVHFSIFIRGHFGILFRKRKFSKLSILLILLSLIEIYIR